MDQFTTAHALNGCPKSIQGELVKVAKELAYLYPLQANVRNSNQEAALIDLISLVYGKWMPEWNESKGQLNTFIGTCLHNHAKLLKRNTNNYKLASKTDIAKGKKIIEKTYKVKAGKNRGDVVTKQFVERSEFAKRELNTLDEDVNSNDDGSSETRLDNVISNEPSIEEVLMNNDEQDARVRVALSVLGIRPEDYEDDDSEYSAIERAVDDALEAAKKSKKKLRRKRYERKKKSA